MIHRDDEMALLNGVLRGRVGRRDLVRQAAALGISAPAVSALLQVSSRQPWRIRRRHPGGWRHVLGLHHLGAGIRPGQPHSLRGVSSSNMWGKELMYDSLLEWDRDLHIQPALAESYEVNEDATSYTFTLRQASSSTTVRR